MTSYLPKEFIKAHLKQFDEGMVKITSYSPNKKFNNGLLGSAREGSQEFTTFVMPKTLVKDMISAANGNSDILEDLLGFSRGDLKGNFHILEIDRPTNIRVPSGNEGGTFKIFGNQEVRHGLAVFQKVLLMHLNGEIITKLV